MKALLTSLGLLLPLLGFSQNTLELSVSSTHVRVGKDTTMGPVEVKAHPLRVNLTAHQLQVHTDHTLTNYTVTSLVFQDGQVKYKLSNGGSGKIYLVENRFTLAIPKDHRNLVLEDCTTTFN